MMGMSFGDEISKPPGSGCLLCLWTGKVYLNSIMCVVVHIYIPSIDGAPSHIVGQTKHALAGIQIYIYIYVNVYDDVVDNEDGCW